MLLSMKDLGSYCWGYSGDNHNDNLGAKLGPALSNSKLTRVKGLFITGQGRGVKVDGW